MSTDTDYVITIKGKDSALRKAAADYIELLLQPWNPQRNDKKTLTRIDVFRNESNSGGFLTPGSLCEEAAKLFPGTDISFESKNEYGHTEEGQWNEDGEPPKDINGTVAVKALERIQSDVESLENRVDWLTPLAKWASSNKAPKKALEPIKEALKEAKAAEKELEAKREAGEKVKIEQETKDKLSLEAATCWSFHPVLANETRKIGTLRKPQILKWVSQRSKSSWIPCESGDVNQCIAEAIQQECTSVCIGFPISTESKEAEGFLETQLYEKLKKESPFVFLQTPRRFRGLGVNILKHTDTFFALLSPESIEGPLFEFRFRSSLQMAALLEGAGMYQIVGDKALAANHDFNERVRSDCLACKDAYVYAAVDNVHRRTNPSGRIFCLSHADGQIVWSSKYCFHVCCALVVLDSSNLLAVVGTAGSPFLICLDAATGQERWRKPLDESIGPSFRIAGSGKTALLLSWNRDPVKVEKPGATSYAYETKQARLSWWNVSTGDLLLERVLPHEERPEPELAMDSKGVYVAGKSWITSFSLEGADAWTIHLAKADRGKIVLTGAGTALVCRGNLGIACIKTEGGAIAWTAQDSETWDVLVGCNNIAFSTGENCCTARNVFDGSLLWQNKLKSETGRFYETPVLVNDRFFVVDTHEDLLRWFDVTSGTEAGTIGVSTRSSPIPTKNGLWVAVEDLWLGSKGAGTQVVCLDPKVGPPKGPWPMTHQGEGCASFLSGT